MERVIGCCGVWAFLLLSLISCGVNAINNRPIIGILTQPSFDPISQWGESYIAASYVKYVESGGGRVVPVFHNSTTEELIKSSSTSMDFFFLEEELI